jgi:hypothetical protein
MKETWYVFYDGPVTFGERGSEELVLLLDSKGAATVEYNLLRDRLLFQAKWETGHEDGGQYFWEEDNEVYYCGHVALRIGKAVWK